MDNNDLVSITSDDIRPMSTKDTKCAPNKTFENGSCITLEAFIKMANAFNEENPSNPIKLSTTHETLHPEKYKRYLVHQFKLRFKNCGDQICWTKQSFMKRLNEKSKEDITKNTFRPKGPGGQFTWLNTTNIDEVMKQYESKYPDFKFLGTGPIDFDDYPEYGIQKWDYEKEYNSGKTKWGCIFNLDRHDQSGSHWVGMFADLNKGQCYYFDSYGIKPPQEILKLMKRIGNFIKNKLGKEPIIDYNRMQHQKKGSECGPYSMSFILRMLKGDSLEHFNKERVTDDQINQCRKHYFT
jgi:hypothetical protein